MVITLDSESSDPGSSPGRTLFFSCCFPQVTKFRARRVKPLTQNTIYNIHLLEKILHGDIPLFPMSTTAAPRGTAIRGPRRALEVAVNWTSNAYGTEITLIIWRTLGPRTRD